MLHNVKADEELCELGKSTPADYENGIYPGYEKLSNDTYLHR